jgi:hypothetical protein
MKVIKSISFFLLWLITTIFVLFFLVFENIFSFFHTYSKKLNYYFDQKFIKVWR